MQLQATRPLHFGQFTEKQLDRLQEAEPRIRGILCTAQMMVGLPVVDEFIKATPEEKPEKEAALIDSIKREDFHLYTVIERLDSWQGIPSDAIVEALKNRLAELKNNPS